MVAVVTLGIDLASPLQAKRTATCKVEWSDSKAHALDVILGGDDEVLLARICGADRVGIDAPFGWPDEFVDAVVAHKTLRCWPDCSVNTLRLRETDRFVKSETALNPLSVSADKIGVTAMRAAKLLSRLAAAGQPVDRTGSGRLVEVYPAAALKRWGFPHKGYKKTNASEKRRALVAAIETRTATWLHLQDHVREACEVNDDALDALIAALVARAAALNLCEPIPQESKERAGREGWIALPKLGSLDNLVRDSLSPRV